MAQDLEQLVLSISADTRQMQRALRRLEGDIGGFAKRTERQVNQTTAAFGRMNKMVSSINIGALRGAAIGLAGGLGAAEVIRLADSYTQMQNALRVAGLEGEALTEVYRKLFDAAQRNYVPVDALVTLFGRASIVQKELGVSTERLVGFTDTIGKALRVAGTDAQSASGSLLQLSQALGSGVVRAEEFNSIQEGALPILQAAANGIKEAGGSVARLRQLVIEGKVASKAFFEGIEAGASTLDQRLAGAEETVSQALIRFRNVLLDTIGDMDSGSEGSRKLADAIDYLSKAVDGSDFAGFTADVINFAREIAEAAKLVIDLAEAAGRLTGANQLGPWLQKQAQARRAAAAEEAGNPNLQKPLHLGSQYGLNKPLGLGNAFPKTRRQVSLSDYEVAGANKKKRGKSEEERQAERIQRVVDSLKFEAEQIGRTAREQAIHNELRSAGTTLATKEGQEIAKLTGNLFDMEEAQKRAVQAADDMRDIAQGAVSSLVDDLRRGVTAGEAFKKVLDDIAGKLIDMAMNSLFDDLFKKGGSGGGIMDFVSSLLGPARAGGGPVRAGALTPVGERGPELFVPEVNGRIIPNHKLAGVMSGRGGGGVTVNNFGAPEDVSVTRDAHGNTTVDVLAQVKADIGRDMLRGQGAIGQAARASGVQKPLKG